jgi:hypothetical protein
VLKALSSAFVPVSVAFDVVISILRIWFAIHRVDG